MLRKPDNIENTPNGGCKLTYRCPACGTLTVVELDGNKSMDLFDGLCHRKPIQDIFPGKDAEAIRETMLSGLCKKCQDDFFNSDEDEEA